MDELNEALRVSDLAFEKYGPSHQINKTQEELLELVIELGRVRRGYGNSIAIIDEIADVWLTTIHMAKLFGWEECIERFKFKTSRLEGIVKEGFY